MRILAAILAVLAFSTVAFAAYVPPKSLSTPDDDNLTGCFQDSVLVDTDGDGSGDACVARQPGS